MGRIAMGPECQSHHYQNLSMCAFYYSAMICEIPQPQ